MWIRLYFFKVDKAQYERNLFSGTSDDSYLNILKRFTNWNLKTEILEPSWAKILLSENKLTLLATESQLHLKSFEMLVTSILSPTYLVFNIHSWHYDVGDITFSVTNSKMFCNQHLSPTSMWTTDEFYCWHGLKTEISFHCI